MCAKIIKQLVKSARKTTSGTSEQVPLLSYWGGGGKTVLPVGQSQKKSSMVDLVGNKLAAVAAFGSK